MHYRLRLDSPHGPHALLAMAERAGWSGELSRRCDIGHFSTAHADRILSATLLVCTVSTQQSRRWIQGNRC